MSNLEITNAKFKVRYQMANQFGEWLKILDKERFNKIIVNSLPADDWEWERLIAYEAHKFPSLECLIRAYENKQDVFLLSARPFAPHWKRQNCSIEYRRAEFVHYLEENAANFSWQDLCGDPIPANLDVFKKGIRLGDVIYITFGVKCRTRYNVDPRVMRKFNSNGQLMKKAVIEVLEEIITRKLGNNFTRIFQANYIGGKNTPMLTIGWHFINSSPINKIGLTVN